MLIPFGMQLVTFGMTPRIYLCVFHTISRVMALRWAPIYGA